MKEPSLPPGTVTLYEFGGHPYPKRLVIAPCRDGYEILMVCRMDVDYTNEPPLSRETVIEIANKMIEVVS